MSIIMRWLLTTTLLYLVSQSVSGRKRDETMLYGAFGCRVVEATLLRLETSRVFVDSHLVLQRLAMVFNFGNQSAFSDDDHKGIWKISTTLWEYQHHIVFKNWTEAYRNWMFDRIWASFCIDWSTARYQDMHRPMYAAIAIALIIQDISCYEDWPIESHIEDQINILLKHFYKHWTKNLVETFRERYKMYADEFDSTIIGDGCMQCKPPGMDLYFVIDASGSVDAREFDYQKKFVKRFLETYKLGPNHDDNRAAICFFADSKRTREENKTYFSMRQMQKWTAEGKNAVEEAFRTYRRQPRATTHTDDGIDTVRWLYDEETDGSRASDPAIPQVMILFTDGNATRPKRLVESIYHLERAAPRLVRIAIGTHNDSVLSQLKQIAGSRGYAVKYSSFKEFYDNFPSVLRASCVLVPILTSMNQHVESGYALQKRRSGMTKRATIPLRGLKVGQGRTVAIPYSPGDTVSVRMFSKRNVIKTMYSFDGIPPNARKHDHAEVTMPGKRAVTVLKPFKLQDYNTCDPKTRPGAPPRLEEGFVPKTLCESGESCIVMNIFPCGCGEEGVKPIVDIPGQLGKDGPIKWKNISLPDLGMGLGLSPKPQKSHILKRESNAFERLALHKRGSSKKDGRNMRNVERKIPNVPGMDESNDPNLPPGTPFEDCDDQCQGYKEVDGLTVHTISKRPKN